MTRHQRTYIAIAVGGFAFGATPLAIVTLFSQASNNFPWYAPLIGGGICAALVVVFLLLADWVAK